MTALTLVDLIMITRCPSAITIRQLGRKKNLLLKELTPYLACTKHSRGCTARAWVQREHKLRAWGSFFIGVKSWESKVSQAHFFIGEFKARKERERKGEKRALNGQLLSQPRSLHKGALGRGGGHKSYSALDLVLWLINFHWSDATLEWLPGQSKLKSGTWTIRTNANCQGLHHTIYKHTHTHTLLWRQIATSSTRKEI